MTLIDVLPRDIDEIQRVLLRFEEEHPEIRNDIKQTIRRFTDIDPYGRKPNDS